MKICLSKIRIVSKIFLPIKNTVSDNKATIQSLKVEVTELKNDMNITKIATTDKLENFNQTRGSIQNEMATIQSDIQDLKLLAVAKSCLEIANHGLNVSKVGRLKEWQKVQ